ncbi:hypothetical protein HJG60_009203 [Phyllostomus discolor]|uniref:Uncharacterized protein n=1 Tax=Phyllostomus discolor TaxID=89673 RepID=A0A833YPK8_9CHIR|nr:hypothetical protein HJG60_009203 [Phyllostomus discolor]
MWFPGATNPSAGSTAPPVCRQLHGTRGPAQKAAEPQSPAESPKGRWHFTCTQPLSRHHRPPPPTPLSPTTVRAVTSACVSLPSEAPRQNQQTLLGPCYALDCLEDSLQVLTRFLPQNCPALWGRCHPYPRLLAEGSGVQRRTGTQPRSRAPCGKRQTIPGRGRHPLSQSPEPSVPRHLPRCVRGPVSCDLNIKTPVCERLRASGVEILPKQLDRGQGAPGKSLALFSWLHAQPSKWNNNEGLQGATSA